MGPTGASNTPKVLILNLGGEAEVNGVINQQPQWADLNSIASRSGQTLRHYLLQGEAFLFCDNENLPFPDASVDEVITNGVPLDINTWIVPGVQTSEICRILRSGGIWRDNGSVVFTKP